MELQNNDLTSAFGASATFSSVLPLKKTGYNISVANIQDKVTDPRLQAYAYHDGISITALRQWAWQVTYTHVAEPQREQTAIGYPIGNFEGWGIMGWGECGRTHNGVTLIERGSETLNVVDNWANLLAIESMDYNLIDIQRGDYLVLNNTQTTVALRNVGKVLSGRYRFVYLFNPRTQSVLQKHLQYKLGVNGYWCDQSAMLWGCFDWRDLWHHLIDNGHQRPVWQSCLRCKHYPSCQPLRGNWDFVCDRYEPIGEAGRPKYEKSQV